MKVKRQYAITLENPAEKQQPLYLVPDNGIIPCVKQFIRCIKQFGVSPQTERLPVRAKMTSDDGDILIQVVGRSEAEAATSLIKAAFKL